MVKAKRFNFTFAISDISVPDIDIRQYRELIFCDAKKGGELLLPLFIAPSTLPPYNGVSTPPVVAV
jgi:hypothetical protein